MTDFRGNRAALRVRDGHGEGIHDVRHGDLSIGHRSTAESQGRPAKYEQGHSQFSDIAEAAPEAGRAPEGLLPTSQWMATAAQAAATIAYPWSLRTMSSMFSKQDLWQSAMHASLNRLSRIRLA